MFYLSESSWFGCVRRAVGYDAPSVSVGDVLAPAVIVGEATQGAAGVSRIVGGD